MEKISENIIEDKKDTGKDSKKFSLSVDLERGGDKLAGALDEVGKSLLHNEAIDEGEAEKLKEALNGLKYEYPQGRSMSLKEITEEREFLHGTFEYWDKSTADKAKISAEICLPANQKWTDLETDIKPDKFGEYTLNPEVQGLNFETTKVFIPDLSAFNGKKLSVVAQHLVSVYGDRYYLPGLEYERWIFNHQDTDSLPEGPEFETLKKELTDNWCFFFGSTLRGSNGRWYVPYLFWDGSSWYRNAYWLDRTWDSDFRVVLLER